jgi:hypothetical protein
MSSRIPPDNFLRQAAECERMAKFARDPESKVTWRRMAERWLRCAERFTGQSMASPYDGSAKSERKAISRWAH